MPLFNWLIRAVIGVSLAFQAVDAPASGLVDTTFGAGGYARLSGASAPGPQAVVVRSDGVTIFAASRPTTSRDLVVGALTPEGRPDVRFAGGGLLTIATAGTLYRPTLLRDSRTNTTLLAASDYRGGAYRMMLCRIRDDGSLDPSFTTAGYTSQTGCVSVDPPAFASSGVLPAGLGTRPNGEILLGGSAYNFNTNSFRAFYASFTPLDVSNSGVNTIVVPLINSVFINAAALEPLTGDMIYTGMLRYANSSDSSLIVFRFASSSVSSYLYNGNAVPNATEDGRAIVVRGNNEIYVVGSIEIAGGKTDCMVFRLDGDMLAAGNFGPAHDGRRSVRFLGNVNDSASCETLMLDGNGIVVGGRVGVNGDQRHELAVARLDNNGEFDPLFGSGGISRISPGLSPARSERVLALGSHLGRTILAGPSELAQGSTPATTDMVLLRLHSDDVIYTNGF